MSRKKLITRGSSWQTLMWKVYIQWFNDTLTEEDLLFSHRIGTAHHKCTWVERHQFKGCARCKIDDLLLSGEGVLRAAVAGEIRELTLKIWTCFSQYWSTLAVKSLLYVHHTKKVTQHSWEHCDITTVLSNVSGASSVYMRGDRLVLTWCPGKASAPCSWVTRGTSPWRRRLWSLQCGGQSVHRAGRTAAWQLQDN